MNRLICKECGTETGHESLKGLCPRCLFLLAEDPEVTGSDSAAESDSPASGDRLRYFGDYEILSEIARGGMGAVYRARQVSLNRIVALKLMLSGEFASRTERERFQNEAEGAAKLQHPNIVSIHEIGSAQGQPYFSMDFVEGESLAEQIRRQPPTALQAAEWIRSLAEAVEYAHRQGILHRDLKPQNVLVDKSDRLRITDFGLSKRIDSGQDLTVTGSVLGTPGYMAPEQAAGALPLIGPATDVYGLGAILYELLTGRPPFREETAARTIVKVMQDEPVRPSKLVPTCPPALETICLKSLEKSPTQRYASAQHLADELGRFVRGEPILAVPSSAARRAWSWSVRHPWILTGLASVLMLSLLGLVWGLWERTRFLMWQASGLPKPARSEIPEIIAMCAMAVGFYISVGLYALSARRKTLGQVLSQKQLKILGIFGAFQAASAVISSFILISKTAWGYVGRGDPVFPMFLGLHFIFLWPGILLCWESVIGMRAVHQGVVAPRQAPPKTRLAMNLGSFLLAGFCFAVSLNLFVKFAIVDRGYESPWPFRRENYHPNMSVAKVNKWWAAHYDFLLEQSNRLQNEFPMPAFWVASTIFILGVVRQDRAGHWRKILPLAILINGVMLFIINLPLIFMAQAVLVGVLGGFIILRAANLRQTSEPKKPSIFSAAVDIRLFAKCWFAALALSTAISIWLNPGDYLEALPIAFVSSLAGSVLGALLASWKVLSRDHKTAAIAGVLIASYALPLMVAAAALVYFLRKSIFRSELFRSDPQTV